MAVFTFKTMKQYKKEPLKNKPLDIKNITYIHKTEVQFLNADNIKPLIRSLNKKVFCLVHRRK